MTAPNEIKPEMNRASSAALFTTRSLFAGKDLGSTRAAVVVKSLSINGDQLGTALAEQGRFRPVE